MALANFAGNFLAAFTQAKQVKKRSEQDEKEKKALLALTEIQLDREKAAQAQRLEQEEARKQLFAQLGQPGALPAGQTPPINGADGGGILPKREAGLDLPPWIIPIQPEQKQPRSLVDMLADPSLATLFMKAGLANLGDFVKPQAAGGVNNALLEKLLSGGGGGVPGFEVSGIKLDAQGNPMIDMTRSGEVKRWMPSPDGRSTIGVDAMGRPVATRPAGPGDRAKEDLPLTPAELMNFADEKGNAPPPGVTLRDMQARGYKPTLGDKVTPEQAGKISGLVQAKEIATTARSHFMRPDGSIDRALVLTAFAKAPGTKGRTLRNDLGIAVDAVLRARTGASFNREEITAVAEQFIPGPLDSDEGIANKMDRLDQFVNGALDVVTLPPRIKKALEASATQTESKVIDFKDLPP